MSKTSDNSLTRTYRGKFGKDFVFRNRDNMSIMAKPPKKSAKAPTESQIEVRKKFKNAARWAKQALQEPDTLAFYQSVAKGMKTPFAKAVADYMRPPEVVSINTEAYQGNIGDRISVVAVDNLMVKHVTLSIYNPDGSLAETGQCVDSFNEDTWYFTATVAVADTAGLVVRAIAEDIPCHKGELSVTL